jgi:serine phosphatase RsbU (regulator of sigma subunit)
MPHGGEVGLASDGVCDQRMGEKRLSEVIVTEAASLARATSLHEAIVCLVERALRQNPQDDDISIITVRNR